MEFLRSDRLFSLFGCLLGGELTAESTPLLLPPPPPLCPPSPSVTSSTEELESLCVRELELLWYLTLPAL